MQHRHDRQLHAARWCRHHIPGAGQPYSGTMTRPEQQFFIGAHPSFDGARPMTSPLYMVAIVPRKMAKAEAARISQLLLRNLGVGTKRPKRVFVSAGGGASSYDVNLTEAASAADSPSAAAVRSASASEAASAGDVTAALLAAVEFVTEAATAAESASSGAATSSAITEAASASDAPAASSVRSAPSLNRPRPAMWSQLWPRCSQPSARRHRPATLPPGADCCRGSC